MNWIIISLIGPALWALVNHIDKYVISKYFTGKGVGSLVLFTSASGLIISLFIFIFGSSHLSIGTLNVLFIGINGAILVASFIPYLYALENEEASWASTLFQLIPVFGYILGFIFLDEKITKLQLFASLLVILGAVFISLDLSQKIRFKARPFWLMVLSSFMLAVNALIFKIVALDGNFWGTAFWEYIGGGIFGLLLYVSIPLYRVQFITTIQKARTKVLSINLISELLNIGAKLAANFASLLAPLVLVWVVNGLQPLIVFIYGIILTLFFPTLGKENISKRVIIQKLFAMVIMLFGIYLLFI